MKLFSKGTGFSIVLLGLISMGAGFSQEFSADMVTQTGGQETSAKFYSAKDKTRIEMPDSVVITRIDKMATYICVESEKMCMQQSINPNLVAQASVSLPGEVERKSLGNEEVSGEAAEKFLVTYDAGSGRQGVYQWINADGFPVKSASEDGSWTVVYQNIQAGPQPADLFEIPSGYQTMAMPDLGNLISQVSFESDQP